MKVLYTGIFIPNLDTQLMEKKGWGTLSKKIKNPHITIKFRPCEEEVFEELFGETVSITITGYGNNGCNEGLSVIATANNPKLQSLIDKVEIPHITLSVSEEGKPVDTRFLTFSQIKPVTIEGFYGCFTSGGVTCAMARNLDWGHMSQKGE